MKQVTYEAGANFPSFYSVKQLGVFLLSSGWDASPLRGYPGITFAISYLYSLVERGTVRVRCLAQEHNMVSIAKDQTQNARS